jgi:hypothetical protein
MIVNILKSKLYLDIFLTLIYQNHFIHSKNIVKIDFFDCPAGYFGENCQYGIKIRNIYFSFKTFILYQKHMF